MVLSILEGSSATCPGGKGGIRGGGEGDGAKPPPRMAPAFSPPPPELPPGVVPAPGETPVGVGLLPPLAPSGAGGPEGGLLTTVTVDVAPPSAAACCNKSATPAAAMVQRERVVHRLAGKLLKTWLGSGRQGSWRAAAAGRRRLATTLQRLIRAPRR